jgi:PAS domain S-box-containing protein
MPRFQHEGFTARPTLVSLAVVFVAIAIGLLFEGPLEQTPFATFYAAIAIVAWLSGARVGLIATVICGGAGWYLFLEPERSLRIDSIQTAMSITVVSIVNSAIVILVDRLRHALHRADMTSQEYRTLFSQAADAVMVYDSSGRYHDANRAAARLTGYSRDEILTRSVFDLTVNPDSAQSRTRFDTVFLTGNWRGESLLRRKDGKIVPVEVAATTIQSGAGERVIVTMRDITERRRAERAQQEFMASVSHELRSPLTSIRGFAQLMQRRGEYDERGVAAISKQTGHLERMINDLMDATVAGAGQLSIQPAPLDLVQLIHSCADEARATLSAHQLRVETPNEPVIGMWDRDRLGQVLSNLLSNAVKYSPNGGEIVIALKTVPDVVTLTVSDQGVGIPAEDLERLYQRFFRSPGQSDRAPGLGLGLFITRALVEAHGGTINVTSIIDEGSTFTVTLPWR